MRQTSGMSITGPSRRIVVEPVKVPREPLPLPERAPAEEPARREDAPAPREPERTGTSALGVVPTGT
jgi:hypothetical protein